MNNTKTITFIGGPNSGKSTLASRVNAALKIKGINSVFVEEYVVDYIADIGIPKTMEHQMVIFEEQLRRERNFHNKRDVILCDSASWTCYIYGKLLMGKLNSKYDVQSSITMYKKVIETMKYWDHIFYLPVVSSISNEDNIRYHNQTESEKIGNMLKSFLDIEQIKYDDLTGLGFDERVDYVVNTILTKNNTKEK